MAKGYSAYVPVFENPTRNSYIVLEDVELVWPLEQVLEFDRLWREGKTILEIAEHFEISDLDSVFLLLFDRLRKGRVNVPKGSLNRFKR